MQEQNVIINQVFKGEIFTAQDIDFVSSKLKKITFDKGDIVLNANEKVTHQYYVADGCLRTFFIDISGKEHTLQFAVKDWWISDYTAFFEQNTGILTIECIQKSTLYKIFRTDLEEVYAKVPQIEVHFRKKLEKAFASFQNRILGNLAKPAKERYLDFIKTYPDIEAKIKNYHIASYLGITTESLSRIRKELVRKL